MTNTIDKQDYTGLFAALTSNDSSKYPIYEYTRSSEAVLCAVMTGLVASGATDDEAIAFMQLKALRLLFDAGLEKAIGEAALAYVLEHAQTELKAHGDDMRELAKTNKPFRTAAHAADDTTGDPMVFFASARGDGCCPVQEEAEQRNFPVPSSAYEVTCYTVQRNYSVVWAASEADAIVAAKHMYEFGVEPFDTQTHGPRRWRASPLCTE